MLLLVVAALAAGLGAVETIAQRRQRVEALTADQREDLFHNEQQFRGLPQDEQDRIRKLHDAIESAPDRDKLVAVMNRYCKWFEDQPPWRRGQLQRLKPSKRIAEIKDVLAKRKAAGNEIRLDDKNRQAVARWLDRYVTEHESRFIEEMIRGPRGGQGKQGGSRNIPGGGNGSGGDAEPTAGGFAKLSPTEQHRAVRTWFYHGLKSNDRAVLAKMSDAEKASLRASLSPEIRTQLDARPHEEQTKVIMRWLSETASSELDERLAEFFESMDGEQRDRLMSLSGDEMYARLVEQYRRHLMRETKPGEPHHGDHEPWNSERPWHGRHAGGGPRGGGRHPDDRGSKSDKEPKASGESPAQDPDNSPEASPKPPDASSPRANSSTEKAAKSAE